MFTAVGLSVTAVWFNRLSFVVPPHRRMHVGVRALRRHVQGAGLMAATRGEQESIICVRRDGDGLQDRFRAYRLVIDGRVVGKLKRGQSLEVGVEPGAHSVLMKIDWCSSKTLDVDVAAGGRISLVCRPVSDATVTANDMVAASRDDYIVLEVDPSA